MIASHVLQVNLQSTRKGPSLVFSEPVIVSSAYRHGLTTEDILHTYFNPIRVFDLDDDMQMFIGPSRAEPHFWSRLEY